MQKKRGEAGSTAVALIFALFILILTAVTVYLFMSKAPWNPGFPPTITAFGALVELIGQGGVDRVVISDARLEGEPLTELRALCSRHGVALTRLTFGLEELVVVASEPVRSHRRLRKV